MLDPLREIAVKGIKPRVSDRTWQALRRLDGGPRGGASGKSGVADEGRAGLTLVDAAAEAGVRLGRGLLGDLDALLAEQPRSKVAVLDDPASGPVAGLIQTCH